MKAVVYRTDKGLCCEEVPTPKPDADQVLVKVANCGFCGSDHSLVQSGMLADGYILGHEISGTVAEVGGDVDPSLIGRRVMIRPTYCGQCDDCLAGRPQFCQNNRRSLGIGDLPGGFAEYLVCYPQMLIPVPDGVDSRNAALAEMFATSLHGMKVVGKSGGSVLVMGGGPIGLGLVKLLKAQGFGPVVLSEPQAAKRELAEKWGADFTIDPLSEDLGKAVFEQTGGQGFNVVYECSGVPDNVQSAMDACRRFGTVCLLSIIGKMASILPLTLNFKEINLTGAYGNDHAENKQVLQMMANGLDGREMISDVVSLEDLPKMYEERIHTGKATKVMLAIGEEF